MKLIPYVDRNGVPQVGAVFGFEHGKAIVTGCHEACTGVLLGLYAMDADRFGVPNSAGIHLTPQEALALAEKITMVARSLLS